MKCPYNDFECDWPESTGDINCATCVHYLKKKEKSVSIFEQFSEFFRKMLSWN